MASFPRAIRLVARKVNVKATAAGCYGSATRQQEPDQSAGLSVVALRFEGPVVEIMVGPVEGMVGHSGHVYRESASTCAPMAWSGCCEGRYAPRQD